jgi:dihydropteroate synthase
MIWRARQFEFTFPGPTRLMGVLNATPDSFFDGGKFMDVTAAVEHGLRLVEEGADILDIGGESTRPGATPVPQEEELRRVLPVIEGLAGRVNVPISIDTMKPGVARAALAAGAAIVNDVAANRADPEMWQLVAESGAGYILMHMRGVPETMQEAPVYDDVVAEVGGFFQERLAAVSAVGVRTEQVVLDVGIGFGKSSEHNLQLLGKLDSLTRWERPLLLGASRKSFITRVAADPVTADRLPGSLACACWGIGHGIDIVRTHDVGATRQAVRVAAAILKNTR